MSRVQIFQTPAEAVADIPSNCVIMTGGFGGAGIPRALIDALSARDVTGLTVIANAVGPRNTKKGIIEGIRAEMVAKSICSFPVPSVNVPNNPFEIGYESGAIDLEIVPQGTMAERIRAGGAGIAGFYTPTGVGTLLTEGKEIREFNGRKYALETALTADYALIKAYRGDTLGNLVYRNAGRNFNPAMASAARITIAEVDEIVEPGQLDPELISTPGIFVNRLVIVKPSYG